MAPVTLAVLPDKVSGSSFPIQVILVIIRLVLQSAVSLRAAASACVVTAEVFGYPGDAEPSHTTVQNMTLRTGLYEITRPKDYADDWIWFVDHTIYGGTSKCFIVLGIRQSQYVKLQRPLRHTDMQVLALIPVETSNGEVVREQFRELARRVGVPLAILSDRGSDLKKGTQLLKNEHPEVVALYDIVHAVSRLIEKRLTADEHWAAYRTACCTCANKLRQSDMAHLKPPKPKTKARYMNIEPEVRWGARSLALLDAARRGELSAAQEQALPLAALEQRLGWLDPFRDSLSQWEKISHVGQTACRVVRECGYGAALPARIRRELGSPGVDVAADLSAQIIAVCDEQSAAVGPLVQLPGSTEVLESLIGTGKRLAGFQATGSFTAQLLAMAATVVEPTAEFIRAALSECRIKHVRSWCQAFLPPSTHAHRRRDLPPTEAEQNMRKHTNPATSSF